jgi:hypothetical protein
MKVFREICAFALFTAQGVAKKPKKNFEEIFTCLSLDPPHEFCCKACLLRNICVGGHFFSALQRSA